MQIVLILLNGWNIFHAAHDRGVGLVKYSNEDFDNANPLLTEIVFKDKW